MLKKNYFSAYANAVFRSWNNPRAEAYRKLNDIRGLLGTAVNVQAMTFGNMGNTSATGVCFSRNPSTGENKFYGGFIINTLGEYVVAGIRTPLRSRLEGSLEWAKSDNIREEERKRLNILLLKKLYLLFINN
ncbi:hypothetical protein OFR22_14300 [Brachyspira hyodysenteriae]|nr:hypothetical protein [Brachyspira hyodysenteriae]